jgi:DNA-binding transcriptional LysR family regulator
MLCSMRMDFDRLRAFVWTVEEGTVSRAAARLHRTQPAVTRLLQALEEQVGHVLIDRDARPLAPTAAGRQMLDIAKQILGLADRLPGMPVHESAARLPLRLGVSRALLWNLTRPEFAMTSDAYPNLDFHVRADWSTRLYHAFCKKELDAAIVLMPVDWSAGVAPNVVPIRREPLAVIAAKAAEGAQNSVLERNWILNPDGCGFRALVAQELARRGARLRVRFEIDAAAQDHITLVASGLGIAVVPRSTLRHHPLAARVREIRFGGRLELASWLLVSDELGAFEGLTARLARLFGRPSARPSDRLPRARRRVA